MNDRMFSLSGKVVLLTGAAGILGQHFARALARAGADLALVDVEAPDELALALAAENSVRAQGYASDLRDPAQFENLVARIERDLGPIGVLHNNAASKGADLKSFFEPDETFDPALWREIMSVNLDSMFFLARVVGPRMAARGAGSIIQTGSIYGLVAPDQRIYEGSLYHGLQISSPAVYSASKAGVVGLTKHLAGLWGARGVRVNCLVPGGVDSGQNDTFRDNYSRRVPMGRMATPDDLLGPLIFLASDASAYVTGQVLAVDGGLTAW